MLNRLLICLFCLLFFNNLSAQWVRLTDNSPPDVIGSMSIDATSDGIVVYVVTEKDIQDSVFFLIKISHDFGLTWKQHQTNSKYRFQSAMDIS
ncbi:hypothetical protein GF407_03270, partial [candidate division KSB1 bacterium]|nr:hypothetical protein [candidate division KSB1 bacterium]